MREIDVTRRALQQLGMERETYEHLTGLSTRFQRLVSLSVDAKYGSDEIFRDKQLRLATRVSERSVAFSDELARYGQEYRFSASDEAPQIDGDLPPALSWDPISDASSNNEGSFEVRKLSDGGEIGRYLACAGMPLRRQREVHRSVAPRGLLELSRL